MHNKTYIFFLLVTTLTMLACISDSGTATKGSQDTTQSSETPGKTTTTIAATKPAKRPTEDMKVNMNGKQISPQTKSKPPVKSVSGNNSITKAPSKVTQPAPKRTPDKIPPGSLPSACDLVTEEYVSEVLGIVAARDIYVKDGSGPNPYKSDSRSCFFKWPYQGEPNAGILIQVQRNSYPDEFPDWAKYHITSKKQQGDKLPDESVTYRYKDFPDMGEDGAYNYQLARYLWRLKSGHIIMVAFNLPTSSEPEQLLWATKIGKVVEKNFQKILNKK